MIYYVQNPTRKATDWGKRPAQQVRAESPSQAAVLIAQRKGRGDWRVNVTSDSAAMPAEYSRFRVRV